MMPEVSAGSNQVGASVTCTAQVSWPSGPAARVEQGMPSTRAMARRARTWRRDARDDSIRTDPTCREIMAFHLRSRIGGEDLRRSFCVIAAWTAPHAQRTDFYFPAGANGERPTLARELCRTLLHRFVVAQRRAR